MFNINGDGGDGVTLVPNTFITGPMKDANDAQVKIYLYLLYAEKAIGKASVRDIAEKFNYTENDIIRSLRWLEARGLLGLTTNSDYKISSIRLTKPTADNHPLRAPGVGACPAAAPRIQENTIQDINENRETAVPLPEGNRPATESFESFLANGDSEKILFVTEKYLGQPLSPDWLRTIYRISRELRFSDDLIDYLLQYCIDRGKKKFSYIMKVAENWAAFGIMTPGQAESSADDAEKAAKRKAAGKRAAPQAPGEKEAEQEKGQCATEDRYTGSPRQKVVKPRTKNIFNQFEQNVYDFDALEEELLSY